MKKKHLLLTLLLALFVPWAANAQVMMLFSEDFEGGTMPSGWTQEYINGTASWSVATGDISTSTGAGQGSYNARIQNNTRGYITRLITPVINLSSVAGAELSFMHIERAWSADIDELRVYYRTSSSGAWTLLPGQEYTAAVPSWTTENEIFLPNISSTYQIAFEFTSRYGYGVGLDDIRIVTGPSCPKPSALTCSNITTTTATLSWTENGSANDWVIQCCIDPEFMCGNAGLFNVSGTPSFTITSFEPGTTYYARVKSSCGGNGESYWSNVVSFTTKHITIVVGNGWSDNFEGSSCNWDLTNSSQTNQWMLGTATNNGGSKALYVSNDSGISNAYTNNAISIVYATKTLTFETAQYFFDYDWKANGESNYDYLRAWLVPSPVDLTAGRLPDGTTYLSSYADRTPEGWISLDGGGKLNLQTEWQTLHEAVNLTAGDYVVVFMWGNDQSSGTNPPAAIDNFSITKVTCPAPIDLIASNITDNSATISWTETGQATNWLLECCTTNDFTCETSFTVSNTPSFNLTSLAPATVYYVRAQALCGDEDDSEWSDVYSFATVTEVGDYWADDFEGSSCSWQFVNGNLANQWVWGTATHHDEGSHSIYISSDGGTNNTFYYSNSCTVYATKLLHFTDDRYNFSYYWRLGGLEGWASLRVALVPASTTLTATDEVDFYHLPEGCIVLDGGEELYTNYNNPSWKHENWIINIPAGNYYLTLIWQNSGSAFDPNPPAAVDNFSITRDVCPHDAENVTVEWTTQNSARLVWNGDGSAYEIAYCPFPFNSSDYQLAYSGGTVIELPGLDYGTTYKVKVRAWCDSDHQGFWSDDVYFTTTCPEYSGLYNQNFDDCVVGDNLLPRCWNYINECTYNYYKIYPKVSQSESHDSGSSGNKLQLKSLVYYYTNDGIQYTDFDPQPQYAILPVFSDVNDLKMTLWARAESISNSGQTLYDATFKVGVMTDPTDASTFTQVATFTPTTQTYVKYTVDFSSYTGNGQYIAIMIEAAEGWGSIIDYVHYYHSVFIDDVRVFSSNPVPANLTVSDITTTSAQITWTPGGEEETWQVAYKRAVDANWTEIADLLDHPSYGFSGLDPDTEYEVKVRAKMEGNFFNWTEPLSFTTEPICAIPIGLQMIEGSATCQGATIEWVDNGDDFTLMMGPVQFTNYFACFFAGDPGDQIPSDFTTTSAYGFVTARDGERTCAKSNNGGQHNTTADMVLSITVPMESDLSFVARVSSEEGYDKAYFSIDGDVQDNFNGLSGDGIWYAYSYTLSAGTHELRWYYQKDVSVSNFGDCLYVGDLTISSYVVDEWTSFEHASSPYTFTGLASNSLYWTKVIRNCSPTNHSEDSYIAGFLTLPCQAPTNLTIDEVTTEYVAFTFDSEPGAYYQYCIVPEGNDPVEYLFEGNTSGPASDTVYYVGYGLLGMHPDTDYRIYVRRKCGDGDFSDVVSVTFHTLNECAAYPTFSLPYTEDFEYVEGINLSDDPTENNLPRCWDYINISSDEKTKYYPVISYSSQNNFLFFSSFYNLLGCVDPQPQYAVLPPMEDVSILKMSFRAKTITNFRGTFSVGVMEGTDASTFEEIVSFDPSTSFQEYTVTFENYTGTGKRIAIMGVAADDSHRRTAVSIDDITLSKYIVDVDAYHDFTDNFENGLEWELANGELTNVWCLGTAAHNGVGTQGLYISNDGGTTNVYNNTSPSMVYAYKTFRLEAGYHEFSYDWLANGEWTWDFLRVALVPETVNLEASTSLPAGLTYTQMPDGWIALDGGIQLGLTTEWQTVSNDIEVLEAGLYKMVFAWRNDGSQGNNPPAAIDNVSVRQNSCIAPTNLFAANLTSHTADLSWTAMPSINAYTVKYRMARNFNAVFSENFENGIDDWTLRDCHTNTGISSTSYTGYHSFYFYYSTNPPQYLISPELTGIAEGMLLEFYYKNHSSTYPETFKVGFSSTDNAIESFTFGYEITASDTQWHLYSEPIPAGTKYICWKYNSDDMYSLYIDDIVVGTEIPAGEWQTATVAGNATEVSTTLTGLNSETPYEVYVYPDCNPDKVSETVIFTTEPVTTVTQTLNLASGVNWVSFNLETTLDDLKTALLSALNNASGIKITSQSNGFTSWNGSSWRGSLNSIDVSQMYVIEVPAACEISLEAMPINPATHPITIVNGINWIGFPFSANMSLTDAFTGFAVNDDKVTSLNNGNANYQGSWSGGLSTLQPGKGYKLEVTTTAPRTFTFPTGAKKAKPFNPMGK